MDPNPDPGLSRDDQDDTDADAASVLNACARCILAYYSPEEFVLLQENPDLGPIIAEISSLRFLSSPPETREDAQAYVWTEQDRHICITFRGTMGFRDILTDLEATREPFVVGAREGAREDSDAAPVHEGFFDQFRSVWPLILEAIGTDAPGDKVFRVSGHSMGASLAEMTAVAIARTFPDAIIECTTFGGPRSGGAAFAKQVLAACARGTYTRVAHALDPVPHIPLRRTWVHPTPPQIIIGGDAADLRVASDDRASAWARAWSFVRRLRRAGIRGHNTWTYYRALQHPGGGGGAIRRRTVAGATTPNGRATGRARYMMSF